MIILSFKFLESGQFDKQSFTKRERKSHGEASPDFSPGNSGKLHFK